MHHCPECALQSWNYKPGVRICQNGHQHPATQPEPPPRPVPGYRVAALSAIGAAVLTTILDHLL